MGDIIEFRKSENHIVYDVVLDHDPYLKTAACNALEIAGYKINKEGVLAFEKDFNLPEDGVLSIDHFPILLLYFNANSRQEILNHIEQRSSAMKQSSNNTNTMLKSIIALLILLFFELYGIVSCICDIINFIKG